MTARCWTSGLSVPAGTQAGGRPSQCVSSFARLGLSVVAFALLAGCGSGLDDLSEAQQKWERERPAAYSYTYRAAAMLPQEARVTVRGSKVTLRLVQDNGTGPRPDQVSVDAVFGYVDEALRDADDVDVEYDGTYGYPVLLRVDDDERAVDDEYGVTIRDFKVER